MRRGWSLLAPMGAVMCVAACGGQSPGTAHRSPSPAAATSRAGRSGVAPAGREAALASRALAGSYLVDLTWVSDQRGWALAAAPCATGFCPRLASTRNGGHSWHALPDPPVHIPYGTADCPAAARPVINLGLPAPGHVSAGRPGAPKQRDVRMVRRKVPGATKTWRKTSCPVARLLHRLHPCPKSGPMTLRGRRCPR